MPHAERPIDKRRWLLQGEQNGVHDSNCSSNYGSLDVHTSSTPLELRKILILMSDTGGGHRASSEALMAAFENEYPAQLSVKMVDFWVELAGYPFSSYPWWYRNLAKFPWLWLFVYYYAKIPPTRWLQEQLWEFMCHNKIKDYLVEHKPDIIVSVHPMVNRLTNSVLRRMRAIDRIPTPAFVTVVTDYGDAHPMWFHPNVDALYVPSEPVRKTALRLQVPESKICLFGLPLRKNFWSSDGDKFETRKSLRLDPELPTFVVVGGGDGMGKLRLLTHIVAQRISNDLGPRAAQMVVICGNNHKLLRSLKSKRWTIPVVMQGFVSNIDEWMTASDFIVTKAGPGTIAEALVKGLPVIVSSYLPGQEEGNMRFIVDNDLGVYAKDPREIAQVACEWLSDRERLAQMCEKARSLGQPSASLDIVRHIHHVGQKNLECCSSRVGLPNEIRTEKGAMCLRILAVSMFFLLVMLLMLWILNFVFF